jgi:hypothetical protein
MFGQGKIELEQAQQQRGMDHSKSMFDRKQARRAYDAAEATKKAEQIAAREALSQQREAANKARIAQESARLRSQTGPSMDSMYSKLGAPGASPEDKQALMGAIATKNTANQALPPPGMKQGGKVKKYAKGGSVSSASSRADGCCTKGKTKGKYL